MVYWIAIMTCISLNHECLAITNHGVHNLIQSRFLPAQMVPTLLQRQKPRMNIQMTSDTDTIMDIGSCQSLIAKSIESFKLSDLYMMEAQLETNLRRWKPSERILIDPNTGSCLFTLDRRFVFSEGQDDVYTLNTPSILNRCDWICDTLAYGTNVNAFLENVQQQTFTLNDFSLDYIYMGKRTKDDLNEEEEKYTSKSLSYRVVQLLSPSTIALNPQNAIEKLILIDTPTALYLGRKISSSYLEQERTNSPFLEQWSSRPFQYSSAMNPTAGKIIIDLINDLVQQENEMEEDTPIYMIDATCGSGTFLALAMEHGMNVCGHDLNDKCIEGTKHNLIHLFGEKVVTERAAVSVSDSSIEESPLSGSHQVLFDCAVCNLPWGQNTEMNVEANQVIFPVWIIMMYFHHNLKLLLPTISPTTNYMLHRKF